jgi:2-keto-4-pentenoate hydratase/2-oxohepta-3-ene-1,7-dioic acid hydratase in catechol pathway
MKLVLFQTSERDEPLPGLLTERGVVNIAGVVENLPTPQLTMQGLIDAFDRLRPALEQQAAQGEALPLSSVRLRAPLPRPGKILCCIANYWEHAQREARPLNMFLKNPEAVIGPGDTIMLPEFTEPWIFMHEAELSLVLKGPEGLGALQDGETVEIEIERIGRMSLKVADPLKRSWERGIYMGADSTNPEAVKRHRPPSST